MAGEHRSRLALAQPINKSTSTATPQSNSTKKIKTQESTRKKRISVIEKHASGWSYCKIAKSLHISALTAYQIIKRWHDENRVEDKGRSELPKKLREWDKRRLRRMTIQEPDATLQEITASSGLNVSERTVGDYLRKQRFYVRVCCRKLHLMKEVRYQRHLFAYQHQFQPPEWWQWHVYTNEVYLQVGTLSRRPTMQWPPGTAFEERYLVPTFVGKPVTVQFWGAFTSKGYSQLVPLHQRSEAERISSKDCLGFNSTQYVYEVMLPHLIPLYEMGGIDSSSQTIEDGASYHTLTFTCKFRLRDGVKRMDWPAHSPVMNPIENVWLIWKGRLWKTIRNPYRPHYGRAEIIQLMQEV
ncbi:hypothetical protein HOY80DRAFT_1105491 [Tuber brumale]|nr:hypothetical protein HOY80DRAFT_1105491 [Tuber brumale]